MAIFTIPLTSARPTSGLRHELDRLFQEATQATASNGWTPAFDVRERTDGYLLEVELPGVSADSLEVLAEDGVLTIKGEKRPRTLAEGERVLLRERTSGTFVRRFRLPKQADAEQVSATYTDGVLVIQISKIAPAKPRRVSVQVGSRASDEHEVTPPIAANGHTAGNGAGDPTSSLSA